MMVSAAIAEARKLSFKRVVVVLDEAHAHLGAAVQEGAYLGGYLFDSYKSTRQTPIAVMLSVKAADPAPVKQALKEGEVICGCVNFARDLLNEPPSVIYPQTLAEAAVHFGGESNLAVEVWDHRRLARERCGGILAVGRGSSTPPCMVIATHAPANARCHLALVGKGITFDSGGYCLKPPKSQEDMKFDMAGAAMMIAATGAIARLGLPIRVTCLSPLAHNAISGTAYNVSEIVRTRSGQTVEVENTDAEGRIILADALTVAIERKPDFLVDAATLTGAAVVALGEDIAAVYGTDPEFTRRVIAAGADTGETLWEMPLHQPYNKEYDSPIADMKNSGARWGGSICAALFLKRFVKDYSPWVHMDIAGPGGKMGPLGHLGKGGKGFGVKTIVALAKQLCSEK
jgi:leucyl aminopeptidase